MKIKVKKDFHDRVEYVRVQKGTTIERDDARAAELIAAGIAAEVKVADKNDEKHDGKK